MRSVSSSSSSSAAFVKADTTTHGNWKGVYGADGFNVVCNHYPKPFEDFCSQVVPLLQRRGVFRTEYEGTTLRENLGLRVPQNRYTRQARPALAKEAS